MFTLYVYRVWKKVDLIIVYSVGDQLLFQNMLEKKITEKMIIQLYPTASSAWGGALASNFVS